VVTGTEGETMRGVNALIETLAARRAVRVGLAGGPADDATGRAMGPAVQAPRAQAIHLTYTPASAGELGPLDLVDMLAERRFGVEYQPIVDAVGLNTHGWEALARFRDGHGRSVPPDRVFARLHDSPLALLYAERELKRLQVAHAPARGRLFLNLDPDAWASGGAAAFLPLLTHEREDGVVVEIVENTSRRDIAQSAHMARELEQAGIAVALDDVNAARGLIATAEHFGVAAVVQGVETHADLEAARALGARFVQGWLFESDCIQCWPEPALSLNTPPESAP